MLTGNQRKLASQALTHAGGFPKGVTLLAERADVQPARSRQGFFFFPLGSRRRKQPVVVVADSAAGQRREPATVGKALEQRKARLRQRVSAESLSTRSTCHPFVRRQDSTQRRLRMGGWQGAVHPVTGRAALPPKGNILPAEQEAPQPKGRTQ